MRRLFGFLLLSGVVLGLLLIVFERERSRQATRVSAKSSVAVAVRPGWTLAPVQGTDPDRTGSVAMPNPMDRATPVGRSARHAQPDEAGTAEIRRFPRLVVVDAGRLQSEEDRLTIRLHGILAPERGWNCKLPSGQAWPCGERAAAALRSFVGSRAVDCEVRSRTAAVILGVCYIGRTDLSIWLLRRGWAELSEETSKVHAEALHVAKKEQLGLWAESVAQDTPPKLPIGQPAKR